MTSLEFDKYFRELYLPLGMFALRIVEDSEAAEDLVAESFTKVWQRISESFEIENFKAYMYTAVRNECLNYLKNKKETDL